MVGAVADPHRLRLRQRLLPLIRSGVLDPTVIVDARIPFAAVPDTYRSLKAQQIVKAVILPEL